MKIVTLSDTHGHLPTDLPDGDVLVIAGDICPVYDHSIDYQHWWLDNRFNLWLDDLSYKEIVCVCGNHDIIFENAPQKVPKLHCNYLQDSMVIIDDVVFYGYPHTIPFCGWAFNADPARLKAAADMIPDSTNVLITHGPPKGILDVVNGRYCTPQFQNHLGDEYLKNKVDSLQNLKLHVFGHIHSGHGKDIINNTVFVNASYINERYEPDYNKIVVDIKI